MSIPKETLLHAYRTMKTIREFEERVNAEIMNGQIPGFTHLYTGQEANAVGVCTHLDESDTIISTHRGHGHCIAKGAEVSGMMKELFGSSEGLCKGKGGSMHVADIDKGILGANGIVAGGPPISVGSALAAKIRKNGKVAVSFSGDGSVNQGTCFEAMNMAVVLQAPAVFVIENNYYSEHTSINYAVGCDDLKARTEAFGFPVYVADGADFYADYEAARKAIAHARAHARSRSHPRPRLLRCPHCCDSSAPLSSQRLKCDSIGAGAGIGIGIGTGTALGPRAHGLLVQPVHTSVEPRAGVHERR